MWPENYGQRSCEIHLLNQLVLYANHTKFNTIWLFPANLERVFYHYEILPHEIPCGGNKKQRTWPDPRQTYWTFRIETDRSNNKKDYLKVISLCRT